MTSKMAAERRLTRSHISIMRNPQFALMSGIITLGKSEVVDGLPTAATNGRDKFYGRAFIDTLNERELNFVVLHENYHVMLQQLTVWRRLFEEDARRANLAADFVINLMIMESDPEEKCVTLPKRNGEVFCCYDKKYTGLNTKQVFDLLKEEQQAGGGGGGQGQPGDGDGESQPGQGSFDDHMWEAAKGMSEVEKQELAREVDQAIRQGLIAQSKLNGTGVGGLNRELGELLEPQVDWREQLREFTKSVCSSKDASSWRRVNRRFIGQDIYLPSLIGERIGRVVIGVDTSGSIGGDALRTFLSEVKAVADEVRPSHIDLIYWDSAVAGHETYDASDMDTLVSSTSPRGGGGTDVKALFDYVEKNRLEPECTIVLTDGYTPFPSAPSHPVLWACTSDVVASFGKTIHIKE